jgi:hypothetical protein
MRRRLARAPTATIKTARRSTVATPVKRPLSSIGILAPVNVVILTLGVLLAICSPGQAAPAPYIACAQGTTLASGAADPALLAVEASRGVRAYWCERYDENGVTTRVGPYREVDADGRPRSQANYVDSKLAGPVTIQNPDGSLFLRGRLEDGQWAGRLEIFHPNGTVWFDARFVSGLLEGEQRTHYPDGALESETRYQRGREDGLARSFYPTAVGGRLRSEAHVEGDQIVGRHRLLDPKGKLVRRIDWDAGPAAWRKRRLRPVRPAARRTIRQPRTQERHLRD